MSEYLSGVRVVKAFNRFDVEVDKFDRPMGNSKGQTDISNKADGCI